MYDDVDVVVVGAGAAGLMAAACAAENGSKVLLLDRNDRPGRKLYITGKGRCNLTNNCDTQTFLGNVQRNHRFLYAAINALSPTDTIALFESLRLPLVTERGNRVFPVSQRAGDVIDTLVKWCGREGVIFQKGKVTGIVIEDNAVAGVKTTDCVIPVKKVILATGGVSYPATGSTGLGFEIARKAGHHITELNASLVPLVSDNACCGDMRGLSLKNIGITVIKGQNKLYQDFGELLFTHFGVSGPVILSASAHLMGQYPCTLSIDLKPALDEKQLEARLLRDFGANSNKLFQNALVGLLPSAMVPVMINRCAVSTGTPVNTVTREQRHKLIGLLKNFEIHITSPGPIEEAVVTSGGVDVKEVDPGTMRSKLVKGLSFAGEMLDVDAYTGGFNLQIAWSTGFLAGRKI